MAFTKTATVSVSQALLLAVHQTWMAIDSEPEPHQMQALDSAMLQLFTSLGVVDLLNTHPPIMTKEDARIIDHLYDDVLLEGDIG